MSIGHLLSPSTLISTYGLAGVFFVIFAETGLFIGFFLPGDTLLFLAGALASTKEPNLPHLALTPLLIGVAVAAIIGNQVGFAIGRTLGHRFLDRGDRGLIRAEYVERTRAVLEKYGEFKAVLFARVIPLVRTFISPVVGALGMSTHRFALANLIGGVIWTTTITLLGYSLGNTINIDKFVLPIIGIVILASFIPFLSEYLRRRRRA